uniref:Integrase catalytic domain-containing protein n=1 Tax=Tanacetum cinerariifolium TaxID=118510 RepID=A0A699GJ86_TANCI|nr:hypothetical protein [Tanacetum cinerariifolium]
MNDAQPKMTSFAKTTHSNVKRPFQGKLVVRTQPRVPRVSNVTKKFPTVDSKFSTVKSTFTADLGNKRKAVKASKQNTTEQGPNCNGISVTFKKYPYIDTQGRLKSDSGCSWHMTENISYLSKYEPYDGGYVSFGQGGGKITDFKLKYYTNVLLRTPRQHNMYSIDLNNIVPHKNLTCLIAKASVDESMLWHRRLGHLNFNTINKLVRNNLVKGLPFKCFENDHTCVAYLKEKQHKASCKTKLVNSVSKPLHTLRMDLFGPTSNSSLNHKWYCLVMTNDFSRFTWTSFLRTKDETSSILRNFITEIENLKDLKVKIIRCDNGGEFKNKEMNEFCTKKGIRREFGNARTPQQNEVDEKRNRTLIEAARTMLADAKLPVTFWAEAVNTAYYVQNRVLVNKSQNKTPYELFNSRTLAIGFLRPFGYHVMILNTLDHLGKLDAKGDEGYFVGYSLSTKAFRVFNMRTKKVEENLYVDFLENKLIEKGADPNWLFDIDTLTNFMNYVPVVVAGTSSTNILGTKDVASQAVKKDVSSLRYIALPNWFHEAHMETSNDTIRNSDAQDDSQKEQDCNADVPKSTRFSNPTATSKVHSGNQVEPDVSLTVESIIPTVSLPVLTVCLDNSLENSSGPRLITKGDFSQKETPYLGNTLTLSNKFEDTFRMKADLSNMKTSIPASPTPTFKIHKDHPKSQIIGPVDTPVQTRRKSNEMEEQSFIATIHQVYVMQPPRFQDPEFPDRVYKVEKAMGTIDQKLFIRKHKGEFLLVQVYVGSSNPHLCREFEALMHDKFQMSAMGELTFFLGLQVLQKKDGIFLSQDKYVTDILKKFVYSDVRSANTLMDKENPWGKDGPDKDVELHLYRSMIGSLMYLTASKPDIMFAVCACARYHVTPKEGHLHAVKGIFRYLKDRKSTIGGCQFLRRWLISWQCKKQTIVATSTTKTEYVAAASSCGQVLWIENQLLDYGNFIMAKLAFCDYHNMVAILEKTEHNTDFHQIVDFLEASHIRYALTISPVVYVSHIRQFWSNARIKTTNQETKILATVDGEGSANLTEPHHTPSPQEHHSPQHDFPPPSHPTTTSEPISQAPIEPLTHSLDAGQDRENINKTSTLPHESSPRVTSLDADEGSMQQRIHELMELCTSLQRQQSQMVSKIRDQDLEISGLKARVKSLEDKEIRSSEPTQEDAPITRGIMKIWEELRA